MSNKTHSLGNGQGVGNATLLANPTLCTLETCDLSMASFEYLPTKFGNAFFAAIFGALIVGQLFLGIKHKTWGYMIAMLLGMILELVGYIARYMLHDKPFNDDNFLIYLVCLTIAPAFLSASIYLCLARIITVYGETLSRWKPRTYTLFFCTCDIICLVLQALGGGIAATSNDKKTNDLGKNLMLAGLVAQVISLTAFAVASADFALAVWKKKGMWNARYLNIVHSKLFKAFLAGLLTATVTIFARSVYRCVELSGGFNSQLFVGHEPLFMVLEGTMIVVACGCLTFLHPALCFQGTWHDANFTFRTPKAGRGKAYTASSTDDEESRVQNGIPLNNVETAYTGQK